MRCIGSNIPFQACPELAEEVCRLLPHAQLDPDMGLDHGVWTVLKPTFPNADIPVVQLSLDASLSSAEHFEQAKRLRPLREQGVLIVGSGNIVHNLRAFSPPMRRRMAGRRISGCISTPRCNRASLTALPII